MKTLTEISLALPEIPGFDDGMVDMRELIRTMAESLVNEIMSAQADIMCEEQGNARNGYRERTLITSVGPISMKTPKVRMGSYFPDGLIERYSRTDRTVVAKRLDMGEKPSVDKLSTASACFLTTKFHRRGLSMRHALQASRKNDPRKPQAL
ncbi:MAG: transposase [Coriobacteriaceae bacterium]|nr:transposase [Coriobacteriaceae bacterium]